MGHWIIIIYVAQDREEAANALGNSYKWNRNVSLSLFLNVASVMSGVRSSAGRLFHTLHTRGPWTVKLRSP